MYVVYTLNDTTIWTPEPTAVAMGDVGRGPDITEE